MEEKLLDLISEYGYLQAGNILLVASGLKKGGVVHIDYQSQEPELLENVGSLNLKIYPIEEKDDSSQRYLIWKNNSIPPKKAAESLIRLEKSPIGEFLGYPTCCINRFTKTITPADYHSKLRNIYHQKGIFGINHLVGILHCPHQINCQSTKELGYADFLYNNAPNIYFAGLISLLRRLDENSLGIMHN